MEGMDAHRAREIAENRYRYNLDEILDEIKDRAVKGYFSTNVRRNSLTRETIGQLKERGYSVDFTLYGFAYRISW